MCVVARNQGLTGLDLCRLGGLQFGGMFGSGIKAAHEALRMYNSYEIVDGEVVGLKQKVKA